MHYKDATIGATNTLLCMYFQVITISIFQNGWLHEGAIICPPCEEICEVRSLMLFIFEGLIYEMISQNNLLLFLWYLFFLMNSLSL